jgi:hypothetical protein
MIDYPPSNMELRCVSRALRDSCVPPILASNKIMPLEQFLSHSDRRSISSALATPRNSLNGPANKPSDKEYSRSSRSYDSLPPTIILHERRERIMAHHTSLHNIPRLVQNKGMFLLLSSFFRGKERICPTQNCTEAQHHVNVFSFPLRVPKPIG